MTAALDTKQIRDVIETSGGDPALAVLDHRNGQRTERTQRVERRRIVCDVGDLEVDVTGRKKLFRAKTAASTRLAEELYPRHYTGAGRSSFSKTARVRRSASMIRSGLVANENRMCCSPVGPYSIPARIATPPSSMRFKRSCDAMS
jgi:hypothetical protein